MLEELKNEKTPFYIYDYNKILENFKQLKECLPCGASVYYSIKANPSYAICQVIHTLTDKAETSSLGEMQLALSVGFKGENLVLSGPGKNMDSLIYAISHGIIISVESIGEIVLISSLCTKVKEKAKIIMRINPAFQRTRSGIVMTGIPSQFGIDYDDIKNAIAYIKHVHDIDLVGLSIYFGSQILDAKDIVENTAYIIKCFIEVEKTYGLNVKIWDFGGGFGVSYYVDKKLNMLELKNEFSKLFLQYQSSVSAKELIFESGRYIVGECGCFVTKVLYKKRSRKRNYLICDGGFNNAMIASFFTREIRGNFPIERISSRRESKNANAEDYYICGPMCTPKDLMGCMVRLNDVEVGDIIIIKAVGAYGLTFSPIFFISNVIPAEIMVKNDKYTTIRKRCEGAFFMENQCPLPEEFINN